MKKLLLLLSALLLTAYEPLAYAASSSGVGSSEFLQSGAGTKPRTFLDKARDTINAADFGFRVTASATNNKIYLQTAIDSFPTGVRGGEVKLPCGSFSVAPGVNILRTQRNITLAGCGNAMAYESGYGGTRLVVSGAGILFNVNLDVAPPGGNYATLRDMAIDGNGVGTTGIKAAGVVTLSNLGVQGFTGHGIWLAGGINNTKLVDVSSNYNTGGYGLLVDNAHGGTNTIFSVERSQFSSNNVGVRITAGKHYSFRHVIIESNASTGLEIYKPTAVENNNGFFEHVWLEGNYTGGAANGYQMTVASQNTNPDVPAYFKFVNVMFNPTLSTYPSQKAINIVNGRNFHFDNPEGQGPSLLGADAYQVSTWNSNGVLSAAELATGSRPWAGRDGNLSEDVGGPQFSGLNVGASGIVLSGPLSLGRGGSLATTKKGSGTTASMANGVPVTVVSSAPAGRYEVYCYITNTKATDYGSFATVVSTGTSSRIVANNAAGGRMVITLSGQNVQCAQSSGGASTIDYVYSSMLP